jgi:hypothetical protein
MVPYLEAAGYEYVRTESVIAGPTDRFGYGRYSATYGNIYTARQLSQLIERVIGRFKPKEDRWVFEDRIIDPFRPGLADAAETEEEYDLLTASHLRKVGEAVRVANVLFFTLGLTEAWISADDGAVFPVCPGTVAGDFDSSRHRFKNFSVAEVISDLETCIAGLRTINQSLRLVLTVSPVPLVATATGQHVLSASSYSKSVLRVACEHVANSCDDVVYFPSYELVVGPQALDYFEEDRRNVSKKGVELVMKALFESSETSSVSHARAVSPQNVSGLSEELARMECEETMTDIRLLDRK